MRKLPTLVAKLTLNHDAWVVGSAADPANENPRDFDVLVPFYAWGPASQLLPSDCRMNSLGGWKCISEGVEVDVWPGDLAFVMRQDAFSVAWHPSSGARIVRIKS